MIRRATLEDVPAIRVIWNRLIRDTTVTFTSEEKTEDQVADLVTSRPVYITADRLGYATYGPFRPGPGYARTAEHSIALDPAAQGKGQGRLLMEAVFGHAREHGVTSLIAGVSAENDSGLGFHTRLGFAEVGRIPAAGYKFDREIALVLMQKPL